jgi:hypothetical protein
MNAEFATIVQDSDLAIAWAKLFAIVMQPGKRHLSPVVISIGGFAGKLPTENAEIRTALDKTLDSTGKYPIDTTALTIFPYRQWVRLNKPACIPFSERCVKQLLPRLRARDRRNQYGTYFERMMDYTGATGSAPRTINQLSHVIELLKKPRRQRESALQIACFDPAKDHTGQPVRGFPCLQQVGIATDDDDRFSINAFYPTQFVFDRAYGNYLGLCQLGDFISHETALAFSHLNCFVGRPERGSVNKSDVEGLLSVTSKIVARHCQKGKNL